MKSGVLAVSVRFIIIARTSVDDGVDVLLHAGWQFQIHDVTHSLPRHKQIII